MDAADRFSDRARLSLGFLTEAETEALGATGVLIPSPSSTLISPGIVFGAGTILWPGVALQIVDGGQLEIGEGAILHSGVRIVAAGRVRVGAGTEIGDEGGFAIRADEGVSITIGRHARLSGGGSLSRHNSMGDGAQILGAIQCRDCRLAAGESHRHPDPDRRGAVLKGAGVAHGLTLSQGQVIQAFGLFATAPVRRQSWFHPTPGLNDGR